MPARNTNSVKASKRTAAKKSKTSKVRAQKVVSVKAAAVSDAAPKTRRPFRYRPGTKAQIRIRQQQKKTKLILRAIPFKRVLKSFVEKYSANMRMSREATDAIQILLEAQATRYLEKVNLASLHRKRKSVNKQDFEFINQLSCM